MSASELFALVTAYLTTISYAYG